VDEDGNTLKEDYANAGYVDEENGYVAPEIDGYTIVNPDDANISPTEEEQTVTLIYAKNPKEIPVADTDPVSTMDTLNPISIALTIFGSALACLGLSVANRRIR